MDTNRVSKELREIASDGASGVSVELVGDSLAHMRGTITGASHNRDVDVFFSVFFRVWCNEIQNIIIIVVVACRLDRNTNSRQNAVVLSLFFFFATGPSETPYQGGTFLVDIHITNAYPFEPPKMKFLTKVWHPNVSSQSGAICLDVLKDQWTPALTIKTALLSVQALLAAAEPDDPQDAVVAKMYVANRAQFDAQAKEWTEKYAKEGQKIEQAKDPKVVKLMEMGFGEQDAERALAKCNFNQEEALEYLLSQ